MIAAQAELNKSSDCHRLSVTAFLSPPFVRHSILS
jgi:hypothetical protein